MKSMDMMRVCVAVVFTAAIFCFMASVAYAEEDPQGLVNTLKAVAADKTEDVKLRCESLGALGDLEVADSPYYSTLASDKADVANVRGESIEDLALSGAADTTVQSTVAGIIADKTDAVAVRQKAISVAEKKLGVDSCGVRDELWTVCTDVTDDSSLRGQAVEVLSRDIDASGVETLSGLLVSQSEHATVRMQIIRSLEGRTEGAFVNAVKNIITTALAPEVESGQGNPFNGVSLAQIDVRMYAVFAASKYLDNAEIVGALKTLATGSGYNVNSRSCAIRVLGQNLAQTNATTTLTSILDNVSDPMMLRTEALRALCAQKNSTSYATACAYLNDADMPVEVRKCAVEILARRIPRSTNPFGGKVTAADAWENCGEAAGVILALARNQNEETALREHATASLNWVTDTAVLQLVREFASDRAVADNLRIIAIRGLVQDGGSVEALSGIANNAEESQNVRAAATIAAQAAALIAQQG
jgi:hypothetical protein